MTPILVRPRPALLLCLLAMLAVACVEPDGPTTGSHIGNPGTLSFIATSALTVPLEPAPQPAAPALVFADDRGTRFTLDEARMFVRRIELYLPPGVSCFDLGPDQVQGAVCDDTGDKLVVDGDRVVDLLAGTAAPSLDHVRVPSLTWSRLDYRLDDADDLPDGDPLSERSFYARASFTDASGQPAVLVLVLDIGEDARVDEPGGVTLPDGGELRVELDAAAWLEGIPLAECLESGELQIVNGVLLIDDERDACGAVEDAIEDNIKRSSRLRALP